jgi:hypothetical protein
VPNVDFDESGHAKFITKYHKEVTLSRNKWDIICAKPERKHLVFNGEKIATALVNPDEVRKSQDNEDIFFYSKKVDRYVLSEGVTATPRKDMGYFVVIIDAKKGRVCTVYPTSKPKAGLLFDPLKG